MSRGLPEGIYEHLITGDVQERIEQAVATGLLAETGDLDAAELPDVLSWHVRERLRPVLGSLKPADQLSLVSALLARADDASGEVVDPPRQLRSISSPSERGAPPSWTRPSSPLSAADLMTNAPGEPSLGAEIRAEVASADRIDLLCAFVKWHGLRFLDESLGLAAARGVPIRVITTTYVGATERKALDILVRKFGADVRVHYDTLRTRLHAKAWMFHRASGFHTGYVGSSNLSVAALLDGVEWNVRLSQVATPALLEKFRATFDAYWSDPSYEPYDPARDADRLDDALIAARGGVRDRVTLTLSGLEVRPYPYQQAMLEDLQVAREVHGRHRNLVVAATGTGKTVLAALDYRSLVTDGVRPRLLFVAHRQEILEQSLRTYREVLADGNFGELYVGGARPERWEHVFASVQSLTSYGIDRIPAEHFDIVVVDEFHHAEASSYIKLLTHLRPTELLGLTATPERSDGFDVRRHFGDRAATELRLWHALEAELLTPFHYFGIADNTDLASLTWKRGQYDTAELENVYTGNDARVLLILKELRARVLDLGAIRALGFCVSVKHAEYMADAFNRAGIPARAVTGRTPDAARRQAVADLRSRQINVLFTVDLFNEGVDIPEVDTVLFLRPTESATVFLQQLGRGLRRIQDKAVLTVLDLVGHQHSEFRFDAKYRALTGATRKGLLKAIADGFPFLPSGCQIDLDRVTQQTVTSSIRAQLNRLQWKNLVADLRAHPTDDLATFLDESGADLGAVYAVSHRGWTVLRREAGLPTLTGGAHEAALLKRARAFAHVDDPDRFQAYRELLAGSVDYDRLPPRAASFARMLFFTLWPDGGGFRSYQEGFDALAQEAAVRDELDQVIAWAFEHAPQVTHRLEGNLDWCPLRTHARYSREELLAATDYANLSRTPRSVMQGVAFAADRGVDNLMVTLHKSERDYSPTTMYQDYALSPTLFHWETQSSTTTESPTGRRYLGHEAAGGHLLLYARERKASDLGAAPYVFLGPAHYVSHRGERPVRITMRLDHPMPSDTFTAARAVAG
ncbi:DUF3427 domain-containing protein [Arsenicicoccus piscis]|uniref:Helicase n=2 Tax=Arsenicicoccus piscis TaxID=673954 RepID=A0ABQ6HT97_9MICO|nr:DUF3427 domain-containing protein [Arsenicicoccus piscis]GMA21684.1 helicase [Arsenicicoccus piscis]